MSDTQNESLADVALPGQDLPQLSDLQMFLAVAAAGSLRLAAREMFVSQPTLSRSLARLETQLGAQLFVRSARGVELTRHGEALQLRAKRVLSAVAGLRHDLNDLASGTLHLGATATSARTLLAPFLSQWMPEHPHVRVTAIEDNERGLLRQLETGRCDLAIVSATTSPVLKTLRLASVRVMAMFPPTHPKADISEPVTVEELADELLLVNGQPFPSTVRLMRELDMVGLAPTIIYECSAGQTLAAMAEAGMGVAVFGDSAHLRGFHLNPRPIITSAGKPLLFELSIAWQAGSIPEWMHEFAINLATFTARTQ